jgi:hypothetical protein
MAIQWHGTHGTAIIGVSRDFFMYTYTNIRLIIFKMAAILALLIGGNDMSLSVVINS